MDNLVNALLRLPVPETERSYSLKSPSATNEVAPKTNLIHYKSEDKRTSLPLLNHNGTSCKREQQGSFMLTHFTTVWFLAEILSFLVNTYVLKCNCMYVLSGKRSITLTLLIPDDRVKKITSEPRLPPPSRLHPTIPAPFALFLGCHRKTIE